MGGVDLYYIPESVNELHNFVDFVIDGKYTLDPKFQEFMKEVTGNRRLFQECRMTKKLAERVDFLTACFPYGRFAKLLDPMEEVLTKNEKISHILQTKGDQYVEDGKNNEAIRCYTLALGYLPGNSIETSSVYSKRSQVFFAMKNYKLALSDINMALGFNCPINLERDLMDKRVAFEGLIVPIKKQREEELREAYRNEVIAKVENNNNEMSPLKALPDLVKVTEDLRMGRCLVAAADLKPGRTVVVEEPFVKSTMNQSRWQTALCDRCLRKSLAPIPCESCIFFTYCSIKCRDEDKLHGHRFECPLMPFVHSMRISNGQHLCLKAICEAGPAELYSYFVQTKSGNSGNPRPWDLPVKEIHTNLNAYKRVLNMAFHDTNPDKAVGAGYAVAFAHALRIKSTFFDEIEDSQRYGFENFVASVILHHFNTFPYNTMAVSAMELEINSIDEYMKKKAGGDYSSMASGIYPIINLMNHSCAPNVFRVHLPGGKIAVITNRKLEEGDELFHSYGPDFLKHDLNWRRTTLLEYYDFICECIACTEVWPMFVNMDHSMELKLICPHCEPTAKDIGIPPPIIRDIGHLDYKRCAICRKVYRTTRTLDTAERVGVILDAADDLVMNNQLRDAVPLLCQCISFYQANVAEPCLQLLTAQTRLADAFELLANNVKSNDPDQGQESSSEIHEEVQVQVQDEEPEREPDNARSVDQVQMEMIGPATEGVEEERVLETVDVVEEKPRQSCTIA